MISISQNNLYHLSLIVFPFFAKKITMALETAKEIIQSLPQRMKPGTGIGVDILYHFKISGGNGGNFTVTVKDGKCEVKEGLEGEPKCIVESTDENYADAEWGRINVQMAVMFGKIKVSNIGSMMKFIEMFIPVKEL